jgi:EmrB/QacA subfamily drug resistance transporter
VARGDLESSRGDGKAGAVLVAMTLANAMILVDQTAVPLALPNIMLDFEVGTVKAQWVLTASLLPLAALLVFGGRLGDLLGRRKVFLAGTGLFLVGSVVGATAPVIEVLYAARVLQGVGGAMILPATVAILSDAYPPEKRGSALGRMGGVAAIFAALGPTIGGTLTSIFDWRAVLAVNVPLTLLTIVLTLRAVPNTAPDPDRDRLDVPGTVLLSVLLAGTVFGLSQGGTEGWLSLPVLGPLVAAACCGVAFVVVEERSDHPLVDFGLFRYRNYVGAVASQTFAGMVELGVGVIFPVLLILNLEMEPAVAGLALIPSTLPMIVLAPLAGRWYDRAGGRPPLIAGFAFLAVAGVLLALGTASDDYLALLPGFLAFGVGLALVLTVNDPVSIDEVPQQHHGQASGVSATAEQFGGAVGIAVLYSVFHTFYVSSLLNRLDYGSGGAFTDAELEHFRASMDAAEATGLHPHTFDRVDYEILQAATHASHVGYIVTFSVMAVLALAGMVLVARFVHRPPAVPEAGVEAG